MAIENLTLEVINAMDAETMRETLRNEYASIQVKKAAAAEAAAAEEARKAEGKKHVDEFFARKFANLKNNG